MERHDVIYNKMLSYLFGLLEKKENKVYEAYLEKCPECRPHLIKARKIINIIETTPLLKAPVRLEEILSKAREIESKVRTRQWFQFVYLSRVIKIMRTSLAVKGSLVLGTLLVLLMFLGPGFFPQDRMVVLKATGEVFINNQSFYNNLDISRNLKKAVRISLGQGECVLQINKDKLLVLEKGTVVQILADRVIQVQLEKGNILGKVQRGKKDKELMIHTEQASFRVVGTVFYIKASHDYAECGVQKGVVESILNKESFIIKDWEKIRVQGHKKKYIVQLDKRGKIFNKILGLSLSQESDEKDIDPVIQKKLKQT